MTEQLYYLDSHCLRFSAVVTGCEPSGDGWAVTLDRTAFFPEGGGQPADTGRIGEATVRDVQESDGEIRHYTDQPVAVGTAVEGVLDAEQRLRRMQNHSGEHIVSGWAHRLFGVDNVGFHMGADGMTVDFNRELSADELRQLERAANETVRADVPIRCFFRAKTSSTHSTTAARSSAARCASWRSKAWISVPAARRTSAGRARSGSSSCSMPNGTAAACASR